MWRKAACAVGGVVVAFAAVYGLSSIDTQSSTANFDLRWLYPATKTDRLPVVKTLPSQPVVAAFNVPAASTTVVTKVPTMKQDLPPSNVQRFVPVEQSAQVRVRTIPVSPVRTVPMEDKKTTTKERLPVGCESAFSPVTMPSMAHISSRCDA